MAVQCLLIKLGRHSLMSYIPAGMPQDSSNLRLEVPVLVPWYSRDIALNADKLRR